MTYGQIIYGDENTGNSFLFAAVPPDNTIMYRTNLMEGRWLKSGEIQDIVVSFEFLEREQSFQIGSLILFQFAGVRHEFDDSDKFLVDEEAAKIVRNIFQWFVYLYYI